GWSQRHHRSEHETAERAVLARHPDGRQSRADVQPQRDESAEQRELRRRRHQPQQSDLRPGDVGAAAAFDDREPAVQVLVREFEVRGFESSSFPSSSVQSVRSVFWFWTLDMPFSALRSKRARYLAVLAVTVIAATYTAGDPAAQS